MLTSWKEEAKPSKSELLLLVWHSSSPVRRNGCHNIKNLLAAWHYACEPPGERNRLLTIN